MSEQEGLRLLIIEPEPLIAIDIERIIGDAYACTATIATDLAKAASDTWDLVICDCPDLSADYIEHLSASIPKDAAVILVSASDTVVQSEAPWPRVGKPFANSCLLSAVRRALAAASGKDEAAETT
ncbi:hypothetical protein ACLB6G_01020 [Zhengella sp. ZM62]|uniref:hypothetical protein n=1 Tax=Zhengella sedimenti TaxID=3390035 RepID=UPI003974DF70